MRKKPDKTLILPLKLLNKMSVKNSIFWYINMLPKKKKGNKILKPNTE